jgi:hypothetical protein
MSASNISVNLYNLLTSRGLDPEVLDPKTGKNPVDPKTGEVDINEGKLFVFDWTSSSGKDYGTAEILLDSDNTLNLYFGDNLGRSMDDADKDEWFQFLRHLKKFASKNFMNFVPQNINRLKFALNNLTTVKEGLFEGYYGNSKVSYMGEATSARLVIKHNRTLGENDARYRYVESLFIETVDGERFKLPFRNLGGGRAMLEHVRQGGRPYDPRGSHIAHIIESLAILSRFRKANQGRILEGQAGLLAEQGNEYYETLRHELKSLQTSKGYNRYFESWQPLEIKPEEQLVEEVRQLFVEQTLDQRIEQALPLLVSLQQKESAPQEAEIFETWISNVAEGTWHTPDNPEAKQQLIDLLSQPELAVGADAEPVISQLDGVLNDDQLYDELRDLASRDPNADAKPLIMQRLEQMTSNNDIREVLVKLQTTDNKNPQSQPTVDEADNLATFEGNPNETGVSIMKESELARLKSLIGKI